MIVKSIKVWYFPVFLKKNSLPLMFQALESECAICTYLICSKNRPNVSSFFVSPFAPFLKTFFGQLHCHTFMHDAILCLYSNIAWMINTKKYSDPIFVMQTKICEKIHKREFLFYLKADSNEKENFFSQLFWVIFKALGEGRRKFPHQKTFHFYWFIVTFVRGCISYYDNCLCLKGLIIIFFLLLPFLSLLSRNLTHHWGGARRIKVMCEILCEEY